MTPYWLAETPPPRPSAVVDDPDVVVVGAGVTGCAAALRLAQAGKRVRLHDARAVAEGASGRNGGFALRGMPAPFDVTAETVGDEAARALMAWTERAIDTIDSQRAVRVPHRRADGADHRRQSVDAASVGERGAGRADPHERTVSPVQPGAPDAAQAHQACGGRSRDVRVGADDRGARANRGRGSPLLGRAKARAGGAESATLARHARPANMVARRVA